MYSHVCITIQCSEEVYSPEELLAMIFNSSRQVAEDYAGTFVMLYLLCIRSLLVYCVVHVCRNKYNSLAVTGQSLNKNTACLTISENGIPKCPIYIHTKNHTLCLTIVLLYAEQPIKDVIITVPPFFNMAQRRAIQL